MPWVTAVFLPWKKRDVLLNDVLVQAIIAVHIYLKTIFSCCLNNLSFRSKFPIGLLMLMMLERTASVSNTFNGICFLNVYNFWQTCHPWKHKRVKIEKRGMKETNLITSCKVNVVHVNFSQKAFKYMAMNVSVKHVWKCIGMPFFIQAYVWLIKYECSGIHTKCGR